MSKYTFIIVLAALLLIVLGMGCTSKISGEKNATNTGQDSKQSASISSQAPTGPVTAKEVDHPFPDVYLGKTLHSGVEYYRDPKSGFTSELGIVGVPCTVSNGDRLNITFNSVVNGTEGNKIIHGSVNFPDNVTDLYIATYLEFSDGRYSIGAFATSNNSSNVTFGTSSLFSAVINAPNVTGEPRAIAFGAGYNYK